jgi:hypothetical protein
VAGSSTHKDPARQTFMVVMDMDQSEIGVSRISKLLIDRDQTDAGDVLARRQGFTVTLLCGVDVANSYVLQLAVVTAANIASRCFPGAVRTALPPGLAASPLMIWPWRKLTFGAALTEILGTNAIIPPDKASSDGRGLVFGNGPEVQGALRVTFDGWVAKVGPAGQTPRLREREYCSLAGVMAAALGVSELFLAFAGISIEAARRPLSLSLWRPDLDIADPAALGEPVGYLPSKLWVLGLGHLGNAYLWSLATLPYIAPEGVEFALMDFDKVETANIETGLIFKEGDKGRKTQVCGRWLNDLKFSKRLVERRFDATFRRQTVTPEDSEPGLALCGFDSNPARRDLVTAQFLRVVEAGLGGNAKNFDTISFHTLPNARKAEELWPDLSLEDQQRAEQEQERIARDNPGYAKLGKDDCGRIELAGKPVAIPFVGVAASCLVVSEVLRLAHGGPAFTDMRLSLGIPARRWARFDGNYPAEAAAGLKFVKARSLLNGE